jgi:hypothetical protein
VAQKEAQMREQARVETERAALEASDEYSQAAAWLRQRPQHRALIEIVVRLMRLEAAQEAKGMLEDGRSWQYSESGDE